MKCDPVKTPIGSAVTGIVGLLGLFCFAGFLGFGGLFRQAETVDRKVGAEHAAHIASRTFFRMDLVRRMVALGIDRGRQGQNMRRTELNAKSASLAPLYNDGNSATRHLVLVSFAVGRRSYG